MEKTSISNQIFAHSQKNPNKSALLRADGTGANYCDVVTVYRAAQTFFKKCGIESYERIALVSQDSFSKWLLILPVMEMAVAVPLDENYSDQQLRDLFKLMKTAYLMTDCVEGTAYTVAESLGMGVILFEVQGTMGSMSCHFSLSQKSAMPSLPYSLRQRELSMLQITSGTTSTPKIVPILYSNRVYAIHNTIHYYQYDETVYQIILSKMFGGITVGLLLEALSIGGRVMIAASLNYNELIALLNKEPITSFTASPAFHLSFVDYIQQRSIQLKHHCLVYVRSSGAPLPTSLRERLTDVFQVPVVQTYGMTETGGIATTYLAPKGYKEGSVGVSMGMQIKVVDDEILVKGETVFPGYETETGFDQERFSDGWFHTGDTGYIDEDGYLFITGRIKEMVNRGGEKVSPYEVEAAIRTHPNVVDVAVFPWPGENGTEEVGAVLVLRHQKPMPLTEIRKHLTGSISSYKMPTLLYFVDKIPTSEAGKVQRKALFEKLDGQYPQVRKQEPLEKDKDQINRPWQNKKLDTATRLLLLWRDILKKKDLGSKDHFFLLGGDSLRAAFLLAVIEDEFDVQIPVNDFFQVPTINYLVSCIERKVNGKKKTFRFLTPMKLDGQGEPLFCVHSASGEVVGYRFLAEQVEERPVYGLKFKLVNVPWKHPLSFREIAARYIEEMKVASPDGPYYLCGTCLGGKIAAEIACQLKEDGKEVALLALFDPIIITKGKKTNIFRQISKKAYRAIRASLSGFSEVSFIDWSSYIARKANGLLRLFRLARDLKRYQQSGVVPNEKTEKEAILSIAHRRHKVRFINEKVYYFQPMDHSEKSARSVKEWMKLVNELEIIPFQGNHNNIHSRENMIFIGQQLNRIIKDIKKSSTLPLP